MNTLANPRLKMPKDDTSSLVFPIRQMLGLPEPNRRPEKGVCRGQACVSWRFEMPTVTKELGDRKRVLSTDIPTVVWTDFTGKNGWKSMSKKRSTSPWN
ncbi:unnamed protein product [Ixodes hexagonus]